MQWRYCINIGLDDNLKLQLHAFSSSVEACSRYRISYRSLMLARVAVFDHRCVYLPAGVRQPPGYVQDLGMNFTALLLVEDVADTLNLLVLPCTCASSPSLSITAVVNSASNSTHHRFGIEEISFGRRELAAIFFQLTEEIERRRTRL